MKNYVSVISLWHPSLMFSCSFSLALTPLFPGKGVQMQRDVQCCMLYSQGKVRTKDVLRFEVQTEGPDCSIQAIMQVFQLSTPGAKEHSNLQAWKICLSLEEGRAGLRGIVIFPGHVVMAGLWAVIAKEVRKEICGNNKPSENTFRASWALPQPVSQGLVK